MAGKVRHVVEYADFSGRVDEAAKTIHDVAVLGAASRNGYRYKSEAMTGAAAKLEGAKVYVDHAGRNGKGRSVKDYVGRLEGLYLDESGQRVRAQKFVIANEGYWPLVAAAGKDDKAFGLSIDATARMDKGGDVLEIVQANSVDLVASPATVTGLFEATSGSEVQTIIFSKPQWTAASAKAWAAAHGFHNNKVDETDSGFRLRQMEPGTFKRMRTSTKDNAGKGLPAGIAFVFGFHEDYGRPDEDHIMEVTEVTLSELQEQRADLVDELHAVWLAEQKKQADAKPDDKPAADKKADDSVREQQADATAQELKALKEQFAAQNRELDIEKALRESNVSACPESLRGALRRCADGKEVRVLLKEWTRRPGQARSAARSDANADPKREEESLQEAFAP